jgi:hypothetical protein
MAKAGGKKAEIPQQPETVIADIETAYDRCDRRFIVGRVS